MSGERRWEIAVCTRCGVIAQSCRCEPWEIDKIPDIERIEVCPASLLDSYKERVERLRAAMDHAEKLLPTNPSEAKAHLYGALCWEDRTELEDWEQEAAAALTEQEKGERHG